MIEYLRTSSLVGQATLRSSPRTSRRNCRGVVRSSLGRGAGAVRGARTGAPASLIAPMRRKWRRCSRLICSGFIDMSTPIGGTFGEQGRRDSNPRPSVLETDALPTELLPYRGPEAGFREEKASSPGLVLVFVAASASLRLAPTRLRLDRCSLGTAPHGGADRRRCVQARVRRVSRTAAPAPAAVA